MKINENPKIMKSTWFLKKRPTHIDMKFYILLDTIKVQLAQGKRQARRAF